MSEVLCGKIIERTGLKRNQILLNASHTHAGPTFGLKDPERFDLTEEQQNRIREYTDRLNRKISGDYAGAAQRFLERKYPGVQAMFMIGCGADANSLFSSEVEQTVLREVRKLESQRRQ